MTAVTLALSSGAIPAEDEPWVRPEQLAYTRAKESVDLLSVCKVASHILYTLSGKRYGVRTETVRPYAGLASVGWWAYQGYESWPAYWVPRPECIRPPDELHLKAPVQAITAVKIDGQTLTSGDYVLYDSRRLMRTRDSSGSQRFWPLNQQLDQPDTEQNTFSVTYQWGHPVPEGGKLAAQVFATELAKYVNKDGSALPDRTLSITRQGVSQTVLDPSDFIKEQRTGLYLVDMWLGTVNPNGLRKRPTVTNPDDVTYRRQT